MNTKSLTLAFCLVLAACGGGGGGGGSSLQVDKSNLSFQTQRKGSLPEAQFVGVRATTEGGRPTFVTAFYPTSEMPPPWLEVSGTSSLPDFKFRLRPKTSDMAAGTYSVTMNVGVSDGSGRILQTRAVEIRYVIVERLAFDLPEGAPAPAFVYGSSLTERSYSLPVIGDRKRWRATSNVPWLQVPSDNFSSSGSLPLKVDSSTLGIGTHSGRLTLTNRDAGSETAILEIVATVAAPQLAVPASLEIGGPDGLDQANGVPLAFSIDTGSNAYPWALTLETADGKSWLESSEESGSVAAAGTSILAQARRELIKGGVHSGAVVISATVRGHVARATVPVTLRREAERLYAEDGVGLAKLPSRQNLTRRLPVTTTLDRLDVPWAAASNAAWLSVTASGRTGQDLVLTANPAGLAADQTHIAEVSLQSSDPLIEDVQTLRVGLWVGSTDPVPVQTPGGSSIAVNPVEPLVYVMQGPFSRIAAYNLYTGAKVREFPSGITELIPPSGMTFDSAGKVLYLMDEPQGAVRAIDPLNGDTLRSYPAIYLGYGVFRELAYARPNGIPTLFPGNGGPHAIDIATGTALANPSPLEFFNTSRAMATSNRGSRIYYASSTVNHSVRVRRSAVRPMDLLVDFFGRAANTAEDSPPYDIAVTPDGETIYTSGQYGFERHQGGATTFIMPPNDSLAFSATEVEIAPNGLVVLAGSGGPGTGLWFYTPAGALLLSKACGQAAIAGSGMVRFSADSLRLACIGILPGADSSGYVFLDAPSL